MSKVLTETGTGTSSPTAAWEDAGGGGLPSGTAGQTLIYDSTAAAFSSIIEVYSATSPNATGLNSIVLGGTIASGDFSIAAGLGSSAYGAQSFSGTGSVTYGTGSHAEGAGSVSAGDICSTEGESCWAGMVPFSCTLATVGGKTVATVTGLVAATYFSAFDTAFLDSVTGGTGANVASGTIDSSTTSGGNSVITFTTIVTDGTAARIVNPSRVTHSRAGGMGAVADLTCKWARGDLFSYAPGIENNGGSQSSIVQLSVRTTDNTPAILKIGGGAVGTGNAAYYPLIRTGFIYGFTASVAGRDISGTDCVYWVRKGVIRNESGTVSLVGSVGTIGADIGTTGGLLWALAITADNTNKAIQIQVTGANSTTIHWTCKLECVEVG